MLVVTKQPEPVFNCEKWSKTAVELFVPENMIQTENPVGTNGQRLNKVVVQLFDQTGVERFKNGLMGSDRTAEADRVALKPSMSGESLVAEFK